MQRDVDRLIERIYNTVDDVGAWNEVVAAMCEQSGGESAVFSIIPKTPRPVPVVSLFRIDPVSMSIYVERRLENPLSKRLAVQPPGVPVASESASGEGRLAG